MNYHPSISKTDYPDTEQGVRDLLKDIYPPDKINPDILDPDPHAKNVWLAIDTKKKITMVVYLAEHDAEQIEFAGKSYRDYMT